ncbi:MAG TPA: AMP-binding protein [Streptosporangiaceae bacterium]|nr:AMP-binding protein [Streptosporangiaceae bacterium]
MELTVPAALARAAQVYGDATALAEPGGPRLSFTDLHEGARTVSRALIASGVAPGDRVALWSPNTWHWVVSALGALSAGATLVPVSTRFTGVEALDVLSRSSARVLVVADEFLGVDRLTALRAAAAQARAEASGIPNHAQPPVSPGRLGLVIRVPMGSGPAADASVLAEAEPGTARTAAQPGTDGATAEEAWALPDWESLGWDGLAERAAAVPPSVAADRAATVEPGHISDILFTSGTTGRSKGAMSTHAQALSVARAWAECGGLASDDRYLVVNPFFHSFGYKAGILACLVSGAALVPMPVFDAEQAMRVIETERITVLPGTPTLYQTILDHPARAAHDLTSLRLAVTGAAPVPVPLIERMRRELSFRTVLTAYGLTEAVVVTMCRPADAPETVSHTSGRPTAGFEVRVAGPGGGPLPPGEPGEILLRGPNVMVGYLDDPTATREAIDAEGWLHTGDIGTLDGDGYLTITDRLKDMYVCGGFNVYPAEVEQALAALPGVAASAVVGVPDGRLGEVGKAFVVARPGHVLETETVVAFCRERLANYKVPRQVEFRADLPRNASGKVLKRVLREESG